MTRHTHASGIKLWSCPWCAARKNTRLARLAIQAIQRKRRAWMIGHAHRYSTREIARSVSCALFSRAKPRPNHRSTP